jgi:hypothetical protein
MPYVASVETGRYAMFYFTLMNVLGHYKRADGLIISEDPDDKGDIHLHNEL